MPTSPQGGFVFRARKVIGVHDSTGSGWQDFPVSIPPGEVDRLMYASLCCVQGGVFEEMHRIREHALRRNVADGVHVALLYQSGWFLEWLEGPAQGVRAVMARVARDPRHRSIKLLHASRGLRRLTEPWSMAMVQAHERPSDFAGRVVALRELHRSGEDLDPASVWRRLSTPMTHPGAAEQAQSDRFQRVMVCSAQGADSFELVRWLGQLHDAEVVHRRFAGSRADARDVATDYVDLACDPVVRRVIAMARNGLQIGLTQAFLPDYSHVILLLAGDPVRDTQLVQRLVAACARLSHRPVVIGLAPIDADHAPLQRLAHAGGLVYLDCELAGSIDAPAWWAAAEPLLDLSLGLHTPEPLPPA